MKVCLDTNVLFSGIFWGGIPGEILKLWSEGHFDLFVSFPILEEYKKTLEEFGADKDPELVAPIDLAPAPGP